MRVKIIEPVAGHADARYNLDDHAFRPGEIAELDDALAQAWIDSGRAALPDSEPPEPPEPPAKKAPARASSHK
jgi:hypothetical protein